MHSSAFSFLFTLFVSPCIYPLTVTLAPTSQLTTSVMLHNNEASSSGIGTTEDE
jgi:hypothetical protein